MSNKIKYLITFTTINRSPKKNYMKTTLNNFFEAVQGYDKNNYKVIIQCSVCQNNDHIPNIDGVDIFVPEEKQTLNQTSLNVLKKSFDYDYEYLLFCQDDLDFSNGVLEFLDQWLERVNCDDVPFVALYGNYGQIKKCMDNNKLKWDYPMDCFYGSLGMLIKKENVIKFANSFEEHLKNPKDFWGKDYGPLVDWKCFDLWFPRIFRAIYPEQKHCYATAPCLIQHIGDESSCRGDECKIIRSKSFVKDIPEDYFQTHSL